MRTQLEITVQIHTHISLHDVRPWKNIDNCSFSQQATNHYWGVSVLHMESLLATTYTHLLICGGIQGVLFMFYICKGAVCCLQHHKEPTEMHDCLNFIKH